jgi:hypothetical protein
MCGKRCSHHHNHNHNHNNNNNNNHNNNHHHDIRQFWDNVPTTVSL